MNLDNLNVKEVFKQGANLNGLQYYKLRGVVQKLMKFDQKKDHLSESELLEIISDNYDLFVAKKNFVTAAGLLVGRPYWDKKIMSIAYVVIEKYRNLGIGTELLGRAIKTCFDEYECLEIILSARVDNVPSRKMIENSHFTLMDEDSAKAIVGTLENHANYSLDYNQYIKKYDRFKKYKTLFER